MQRILQAQIFANRLPPRVFLKLLRNMFALKVLRDNLARQADEPAKSSQKSSRATFLGDFSAAVPAADNEEHPAPR
jgi:hypothetical protein